ncbi:MAG TPA: CusA/CzcA family heavy metal efflux RND transporter [Anaeromyxobacteraceae bacterium]|nr:CusA/CzcA family heavy metal efflux RND transporter [Anaeromyxobacteraceae bacterium]
MIQALVRWSVRHRILVVATTLALMVVGAIVGANLKFDALPDTTNNQVLVLTRAPGLTPEEVERLVTRPVEVALGGLPGLVEQRSLSRYGISSVTAVFEDGLDVYRARQMVQERLSGLSFPQGVSAPELGPVTGGLGEIFHFTLDSPRRSPAELLEIAQFRVAPMLRSVAGVVEVNTWGGEQRVLEVKVDPVRLAARGLSLDDVRQALEHATGTAPGASLPAGSGQTLLRAVAQPRNAGELGYALVFHGGSDRNPVRLSEVAEISMGATTRIGAATENGKGETVYVMAQMLRGENALEVMRRVKRQMVEVRKAVPEDVFVDVVYDRSQLVQGTLRTVFKNLLEGGLLVVAVLFLMLGSWRAGLLVASAIPLSMLGATAAMVAFDVPGNLMSLGALDFGLIVDGAVVMVEAVFHGVDRAAWPTDPARARARWVEHVETVTGTVAQPVFFSVLIILLVYVPVLSLTGVDGKMFRPMALTVVFALAASLVLSLTFIPAATALFLRPRDVPEKTPIIVRWIEKGFLPLLRESTARPWAVAAGSVLLLAVGGALFARAGSEFVPQLDEGDLVVQTTRAADVSLETAVSEAGRLEAVMIAKVPEVKEVVSRIGSPAVATDIMGLEQADVFVLLHPKEKWRDGVDKSRVIEEIDRAAKSVNASAEVSFTQPIQMRFNELLGGSVADVTISIYGDDLAELDRLAARTAEVVGKVPGAADTRVIAPPAVSLLEVRPRPLEASRAGFTVKGLLEAVQSIRTGIEVGATYDGPLRVPILLRLGGGANAFTLADFSIPGPGGGLVPLARVADVEMTASPSLVSRQNGERRIVVGFNVRDADLGTVVSQAEAAVERSVKIPRGYRLEWGGQYETLLAAKRRLAVVIPAVMVLIVAVLLFAFRRVRPAVLIFLNVPFASVGGMIVLALRGMPVSISAAVGFIALSGIAVLNGVVLMSRLLALEEEGKAPGEAAVLAARERARPVLMTALVAALGFVPMMLAQGVGAEVQRPLATVVVGGLVTSTILTLLVIPALYPWFTRLRIGPRGVAAEHDPEVAT